MTAFNSSLVIVSLFFALHVQIGYALISSKNIVHRSPFALKAIWGHIYVGLEEFKEKVSTPTQRRQFLTDIVIDNQRVPWKECELAFAYSLKDDDRDWCFGLFDVTLKKVLAGEFANASDDQAMQFATELTDSLSISATDFDDVATSLMIVQAREAVEDELHEQGVDLDTVVFSFGDEKVSASADKKRREAVFKALCALRFVRLGVNLPI